MWMRTRKTAQRRRKWSDLYTGEQQANEALAMTQTPRRAALPLLYVCGALGGFEQTPTWARQHQGRVYCLSVWDVQDWDSLPEQAPIGYQYHARESMG